MRKTLLLFFMASSLAVSAQPQAGGETGLYFDRLWMQTSADYRANCYQVYSWAARGLRQRAELNPHRDARGRLVERILVRLPNGRVETVERPLAVFMDVDETVVDMSAYRIWMLRMKRGFDRASWQMFLHYQAENPAARRSVPGAVEFIREAEQLGYTVCFLSNRIEAEREDTVRTLAALGVSIEGIQERMLLDLGEEQELALGRQALAEQGIAETSPQALTFLKGQGRKERRRFELQKKYRVVECIGDDMGDFAPFYKDPSWSTEEALQRRYAFVDDQKKRWGSEFFFIPNPMYGLWSPGAALPKQGAEAFLRDDGFVEYWQSHQKTP